MGEDDKKRRQFSNRYTKQYRVKRNLKRRNSEDKGARFDAADSQVI